MVETAFWWRRNRFFRTKDAQESSEVSFLFNWSTHEEIPNFSANRHKKWGIFNSYNFSPPLSLCVTIKSELPQNLLFVCCLFQKMWGKKNIIFFCDDFEMENKKNRMLWWVFCCCTIWQTCFSTLTLRKRLFVLFCNGNRHTEMSHNGMFSSLLGIRKKNHFQKKSPPKIFWMFTEKLRMGPIIDRRNSDDVFRLRPSPKNIIRFFFVFVFVNSSSNHNWQFWKKDASLFGGLSFFFFFWCAFPLFFDYCLSFFSPHSFRFFFY